MGFLELPHPQWSASLALSAQQTRWGWSLWISQVVSTPAWSGKWEQPGQQLNPVTVAWGVCPTVSIDTKARKTVREVTALAEIFTKGHVLPFSRHMASLHLPLCCSQMWPRDRAPGNGTCVGATCTNCEPRLLRAAVPPHSHFSFLPVGCR